MWMSASGLYRSNSQTGATSTVGKPGVAGEKTTAETKKTTVEIEKTVAGKTEILTAPKTNLTTEAVKVGENVSSSVATKAGGTTKKD